MKIIDKKLAEITPYPQNPRKNDEAVDKVAASIKEFGFKQPIVVDGDGIIIVGHTRYKAAQKLGLKTVPVLVADDLTEEQAKAYRLADNKTNEFAEWDFELLDLELFDVGDIDMEQFGFDLTVAESPSVEEDDYSEVVREEPRTIRGGLYQLGEHRLLCGDATSAFDIQKLMAGQKADMVFTDPPYGMKKESEGVLNDNLNYDDLLEFNRQWIPITFEVLKDTGCWYCWGIDEPLMDIYSHVLKPMKKANKIVVRNYITWAKHAAFGIGSDLQLSYPKETEKCWFIMKGMDWNNNNTEFFNTKFEQVLNYMQQEAKRAEIRPKDVQRVCGVQMYGRWFTKSQFCILSREHYQELQKAYSGCFEKPYDELRKLIGDSNNPTADLKPYFDAEAIDRVGDIGLTDVWRFPITSNKEREGLGHATPKPIALCSRAIHASSRKGEKVLDIFGGSGSTLIACEQLKRKCYMMELDPHYCDIIIDRWEQYTGKKAVQIDG